MSRRFTSSSPEWDKRPPQSGHRRQHMHGALQPMETRGAPDWTARLCLAVAGVTALYFAAQLLRGWL